MKWTQLNGDGHRKVMSWFQSWQTRMPRLTNSWKSFTATVPGDAAADAMDSPALLLVDLAKLKTVTIQTTLKRLIQKKRRRRSRSCHLSDSFGGYWVRRPFWSPYWISALGNEPLTFLVDLLCFLPKKPRDRHQNHDICVHTYKVKSTEGFSGHIGRHPEKIHFRGLDFLRLLLCNKVHWKLLESTEKPFVAIFWWLNHILTWLYSQDLSLPN